jgi:Kdo2-lipid IVA lauroyltransferase/acyltransferase
MAFSSLLYHLIVFPVSLLPLRILYLISDIFYLFALLFPYRKNVVYGNIARSFPELSEKERRKLARKFYRHFGDLLVEGIKNISISPTDLRKRMKVVNPELMSTYYAQNKSVLLVSGHYNNWEWMITAQGLLFPQQAVGIGKPLTSKFWDKKLNERRARNGMVIVHGGNVKRVLDEFHHKALAILALSDQSPGDSRKSYWTTFLKQPTAVVFGTEQLAHQYNFAVVFFELKKIKRGYYEIHLHTLTDSPRECAYGEITEMHTRALEEVVRREPAYWLWSHKRWKREIPEDLVALQQQQREKFAEFTAKIKSSS